VCVGHLYVFAQLRRTRAVLLCQCHARVSCILTIHFMYFLREPACLVVVWHAARSYVVLRSSLAWCWCGCPSQLPSLGVNPDSISFRNTTIDSDKTICIREDVGEARNIVIVDVASRMIRHKKPMAAEAAIMNPVCACVCAVARTARTRAPCVRVC
jgi:hypothetical protein